MITELMARVAELERKVARMVTPATVIERDHKKGVRFKVAEDENGNPVKSSWVQPPDWNKGTRSRWLPQVGSQAVLITTPGNEAVTTFVPMSHHKQSPNPATNADETVLFDDGTCRIHIGAGAVVITVGESVVRVESGKILLTADLVKAIGQKLRHNDRNVGDTHKHEDVEPGPSLTGVPIT